MRQLAFVVLLGGTAFAQTIVETGVAAAGGSAAGASGKSVADSITAIFGKVDQQTAKAAQAEKPKAAKPASAASDSGATALAVSSGAAKKSESVPAPPPPVNHASLHKPAPLAAKPAPPVETEPVPPPPPPPEMTAADLKTVTAGMNRDALLQLGAPASRVTMFDEGHLVEVFRYMTNDSTLGVVRLSDGKVSAIEVR